MLDYEYLKKLTITCINDEKLPQNIRDALFTWRTLFHKQRCEAKYLRETVEEYVVREAKAEVEKKTLWRKIRDWIDECGFWVFFIPFENLKLKRKK